MICLSQQEEGPATRHVRVKQRPDYIVGSDERATEVEDSATTTIETSVMMPSLLEKLTTEMSVMTPKLPKVNGNTCERRGMCILDFSFKFNGAYVLDETRCRTWVLVDHGSTEPLVARSANHLLDVNR